MNQFDYLFIAHFIGDYAFQTNWMALNKASKWLPLIIHSFVYTLVIAIVGWWGFGGLAAWKLLLVFLTHVFLDRRFFIKWWLKTIMKTDAAWLGIVLDQTFHFIILGIIVHF